MPPLQRRAATHDGGTGRPHLTRALALWLFAVAMTTLVLARYREDLHEVFKSLAYLLLVLGASARNGRLVGLTLAVVSFFAFTFFLLPPYYTLSLEEPVNWWILGAFLATGVVAAELFHRAQHAVVIAEQRAREIDRLAALSAESISVAGADDAVAAILRVIHSELPIGSARVFVLDPDGQPRVVARAPDSAGVSLDPELVRYAIDEGRTVMVERQGTSSVSPAGAELLTLLQARETHTVMLLPLRVRERTLGVLELADPAGLALDRAQTVFADALTYYVALAVERVRLEAEAESVAALREADRLKDALLASVSHDLRTPLTSIRAAAAEMRAQGSEQGAIIEEEAERLDRFVTDLLDMSRIRAGALPVAPEITAADDLIGAALLEVRGLRGADQIDVRLPPGEVAPAGRFDLVLALRALVNLLDNALGHTPAGERVTLELLLTPDRLVLEVRDRGPGVPPEERERIFEPFYRGKSGGRRRRGAGLGLAIARSLAEAQGGDLGHRPGAEGGSVFSLRLPRWDPPVSS